MEWVESNIGWLAPAVVVAGVVVVAIQNRWDDYKAWVEMMGYEPG